VQSIYVYIYTWSSIHSWIFSTYSWSVLSFNNVDLCWRIILPKKTVFRYLRLLVKCCVTEINLFVNCKDACSSLHVNAVLLTLFFINEMKVICSSLHYYIVIDIFTFTALCIFCVIIFHIHNKGYSFRMRIDTALFGALFSYSVFQWILI